MPCYLVSTCNEHKYIFIAATEIQQHAVTQGEHISSQDFQDFWQKVAFCSEDLQTHLLFLLTRQQ